MPTRRQILALSASLVGCSRQDQRHTWDGFAYFTRGNPSDTPLVVAPVGPSGLGHWLTDSSIDSFVASGFYVVGVHWPGLDGGPEDYGAQHQLIADWLAYLGLKRPILYAQSRGGLQLLNFACDHPDAFSRIACLYPVTDPFVFPGKTPQLWRAHQTSPDAFPISRRSPNVRAGQLRGKAIRIWHGDRDKLVPKHLTTDVFATRSHAQVITMKGVGHIPLWLPEIAAYLKYT